MSFHPVGFNTDQEQQTSKKITDPNNVPLFFIPGIFGHGNCFQHIINELRKLGENRDNHIYYHPSIFSDEEDLECDMSDDIENINTLEEYVNIIVAQIKATLPEPKPPFLIAGYSYGCCIAALVAEKLNEQGCMAFPFLIDGVAPEVSAEYFSNKNSALSKDFLKIIKCAAIETATTESRKNIENNFNSLSYDTLPLQEQDSAQQYFLKLTNHCVNNVFSCTDINFQMFDKYIKNSAQAIKLMSGYKQVSHAKLEQIYAVITNQTIEKYSNYSGGWDTHAKKLTLISEQTLQQSDHLDLLSNEPSKILAIAIKYFMSNVVSADVLYLYHHLCLKRDYYESKGLTLPEEINHLPTTINEHDFPNAHIQVLKIDQDEFGKNKIEFSDQDHLEAISTLESIMNSTHKDIQILKSTSPTHNKKLETKNKKTLNKTNFFYSNEYGTETNNGLNRAERHNDLVKAKSSF